MENTRISDANVITERYMDSILIEERFIDSVVADTKIDGDKATVTVKMEGGKKDKDGKAGKEEEKFDLKKVDGKWKIDFNKEDPTKGKKGTNAA